MAHTTLIEECRTNVHEKQIYAIRKQEAIPIHILKAIFVRIYGYLFLFHAKFTIRFLMKLQSHQNNIKAIQRSRGHPLVNIFL